MAEKEVGVAMEKGRLERFSKMVGHVDGCVDAVE
jgi:hypothetical protein